MGCLNGRDRQVTQAEPYAAGTPPVRAMRSAATRPDARLDAAFAAHDADPLGTDGAHLAGYSFRFDTDAEPAEAEPEAPASAREWTLAETLAEIRRRGATLRVGSLGVRLSHAHRLPALARAVARHDAALRVWVRLDIDAAAPARRGLRAVPFGATAWDDATRLHAAWFVRLFTPPAGRIVLRPGVAVTDLAAFRASVAGRLAAGPDAAGADGLRADLAALFAQFAAEPAVVALPRVARAA